jgi:predicted ATPase/DNA-binding SARP family transcriptional activator
MGAMRISILGPLDVRDEAGRSVEVGGPRLRALLIRLAVDAGHDVQAERLVADLWGAEPPAGAANALQALISRLRAVAGRDLVTSRTGRYRLEVDPAEVDAVAFERLVTLARAVPGGDTEGRAATLRQALALWRGPALLDVADAEFAQVPIARLDGLRISAIEDRVDADLAIGLDAGQATALVPELEELVTRYPLRERLRGGLMRVLDAAGRQADALTLYEETRRELADRLGVDPSPELAAVHLAILRADRQVTTAAPKRSVARGRTNLPAQLTSFVGRADEVRKLGSLLTDSRLVTLIGPGGAGKTRLAGEASAGLLTSMTDGVWFVPLAPVRDPVDVPQAVLSVIGIPDNVRILESGDLAVIRPIDRLTDAVAGKQLLLVLDNCEHLIDAVARLADRVLAMAPKVRILTTSREPLSITGETLCPVPSLPLPPPGTEPAEALSYGSVQLFADRAEAVRPGFAVDADTVAPVIAICRALDGIPLAIELAAARLRALTAGQVADRLGDRFRLLTSGSRTALPQHQTLRAIVDWSWELLDQSERTVLARLSVFTGGATPDAAEQVCGPDGEGDDIIDTIASLIDKSLVVATGDTEVRYRLLETVRAYAGERLAESGAEDAVRTAHAAYFLDLAERGEPELRGHDQVRWADRLATEHDNCIAGLRYAIDQRDVITSLRFVAALAWFWLVRDYEAEAGEWVVAVREIAGDAPPVGVETAYAICVLFATLNAAVVHGEHLDQVRVQAMLDEVRPLIGEAKHPGLVIAVPLIAVVTGDIERARADLLAIADHPDPWVRAGVCAFGGHLALNMGNLDEAETRLADGYAGFKEVGDRWGMVVSLGGMAEVASARGEPMKALRALEEATRHATESMNPSQVAIMRIKQGKYRAEVGDMDGARADLMAGAEAAEAIGERDNAAWGHIELSDIARRTGDLAEARFRLERAQGVLEPLMPRVDLGDVYAAACTKLGCLNEQEGDLAAAAGWHTKALQVIDRNAVLPSNPTLAGVVEGMAALALARGEPVRAAELLGTAHGLHGFRDPASFEVARVTATVTGAIGSAAFESGYERGRRVTRDEVLKLNP